MKFYIDRSMINQSDKFLCIPIYKLKDISEIINQQNEEDGTNIELFHKTGLSEERIGKLNSIYGTNEIEFKAININQYIVKELS